MESCKSIIEATATRWRWMTKCWRLRLPVREALLAPKADTPESVLTKAELEFWKNKAGAIENDLKVAKDANKALVHFIHVRNTPDVDLKAVKKAIATAAIVLLPLLAISQPLEPYRHNFFTTNPAPVVDVLPGTNVSVQLSLTGTSQRHYTVNTDTNLIPIYAGYVTNGYPWTNIFPQGVAGGQTNQVLTQTGWSGYPQITNLSLKTNGIGTAIVPSLWLTNPTPAALGAQQNSPAMMLGGQGWRSGNSTTHSTAMGWYALPIQGSAADPTAQLILVKSIDGVAPTATGFLVDSGGNVSGSQYAVAGTGISLNSVGVYYGSSNQRISGSGSVLTLHATSGSSFDGPIISSSTVDASARLFLGPQTSDWLALKVETTNSPTLSLRNGTGTTYASLVASNITSKSDSLGANIIPSIWLTNATAAALGAQQNSPALMLGGQGWRSGNSTTHSTAMGMYVLPTQGSSSDPVSDLTFVKSIDGAAPTTIASFNSAGSANVVGTLSAANLGAGGAGSIFWSGRSTMQAPAAADIELFNTAGTTFNRLFLGPQTSDWLALKVETTNSPTLSIRTGADGNYASLMASNVVGVSHVLAGNPANAIYPLEVGGSMRGKTSLTTATLLEIGNNSCTIDIGSDSSLGGSVISGSLPYAGVVNVFSSRPLQLGVNNTIAATILVGGNIGIGTTNPSAKLAAFSTTTPIFSLSSESQTNALVFGTNGVLLVTAPTNSVAPPPIVQQPLGLFGSMMMATVTNTLTVGSSGTYYVVSNYTTIRTNGFVAVPATGYLTNLYAGFYRISYYMSAIPGNADQVELEVFVNGTGREEISSFHTYDNPARVDTMNGDGILYLPANSYVNLAANNRSGANNITIWRCGFTIGTP